MERKGRRNEGSERGLGDKQEGESSDRTAVLGQVLNQKLWPFWSDSRACRAGLL